MSFVLTRFQLASTALTVTLKALPAVSVLGVPVLPEALPGEALSPGTSSCSLAKAPGLTVREGLVLAVVPAWTQFCAVGGIGAYMRKRTAAGRE